LYNSRFFDETYRRRWQNPEAILAEIGLKSNFTFMDIGCGEGFFTIPAARIVGKEGRVYGLDRDKEVISVLREKASKVGLANIDLRVGEAEETVLCNNCADIVFYGIVLHDFYNPMKALKNAKKMLKPSGLLVDLDWEKEQMALGPPLFRRISRKNAIELLKSEDFNVDSVKKIGLYYVITAKY